jgi:uncharacterized lipoprotein
MFQVIRKAFKLPTVLAVCGLSLAGCASEPTCNYAKEPYTAAQSVAPLQAPQGLTTPDHSTSLVIPPQPAGAKELPAGKTRCLDRPPSYFATSKPGDSAGADKK